VKLQQSLPTDITSMAEFVAKAAHDLRNPLGVIRSVGEVLESMDTELSAERRSRYINRLLVATENLNELIEDTLTYSYLQAGKYDVMPVETELVAFCQECLEMIQAKAGLPQTVMMQSQAEQCLVQTNLMMMQAIVTHLVQNAVAYSPDNLAAIRVDLTWDEQMVTLVVSDRGLGIPLDHQAHIFEPFFRGENVLEILGSGLGLAIVRQCVERLGGTIGFTSELERGSCFTVRWPRNWVGVGERVGEMAR
jgi:signal transduction histidine kinase